MLKTLEGNISLLCDTLSAKMINGDSLAIHCRKDTDVGAIYGEKTFIRSNNGLNIGLFRGSLNAEVEQGPVRIKGIDGQLQVKAVKGDIELQINSLKAHSTNSVSAEEGNIACSLDPEIIIAEARCTSKSGRNAINISSDAFQAGHGHDSSSVVGRFTGESQNIKRPHFRTANGKSQSGKIDLIGAKRNWLESISKASVNNSVSSSSKESVDNPTTFECQASGKINVKSVSWIDAIRSKHGL